MNKKIKLVALMGESSSGKDTILSKLSLIYSGLHKVVSTTTRPIRDYEKDGKDYFFIDEHGFAEKILNFEMLEATDFNDWFYGTEIKALDENRINVGAYNPDGVRCLLEDSRIDLKVIYIKADDKTRIIRALNREEEPNIEEIFRRYGTDKNDFDSIDFEYVTVANNGDRDLSTVVAHVGALIIEHFGQGQK